MSATFKTTFILSRSFSQKKKFFPVATVMCLKKVHYYSLIKQNRYTHPFPTKNIAKKKDEDRSFIFPSWICFRLQDM